MTISFIGTGALASGLALALHARGYHIEELVYHSVSSRARAKTLAAAVKAQAVALTDATLHADIIWIAAPDGAIAECAATLAKRKELKWKSRIVLHSSAALSSDVLVPLRRLGASVASLHPMMTFPRASKNHPSAPDLSGVFFAFETSSPRDQRSTRACKQVVRALDGELFTLRSSDKPLYHAFGALVSPLLISHLAAASEVAALTKVKPEQARRIMRPIIERTLQNFYAHGPDAALSGPLVRGDLETIGKHLDALSRSPHELDVYRALSLYAAEALQVAKPIELRALLTAETSSRKAKARSASGPSKTTSSTS